MSCLIGLDIGTTSTVGLVIRPGGQTLASTERPATLYSRNPGWAEADPEEWWQNVCALVPELLQQAGVSGEDISGIGVTGMLPAVVLLDENGTILRPSIQQSDGRSGVEVEEIASEIAEADFIARTGNGVNQQLVASRIRWIEKHEPDAFARIATVFGSYDYINWRLTGVKAVEANWALEAGFVVLGRASLSNNLIALAHLPRSAIPKLARGVEVLGHVTLEAALATGLAVGTPVIGGAADHIASAYAAGVMAPGDVLLKFGGAADIMIAADNARPDPRMFLDYHLVPGLYMPNGCMATGGSALNWFVAEFAKAEAAEAARRGLTPHAFMDQLAEDVPPGADGVLFIPYLLGEKTPIHDPEARGVIHGLSLNHSIRHIWRALLEGYGYAFRHHVEVFGDMGYQTTRFLASDGGSKSRLWMEICADILQSPIQLLEGHPGSCLGAAWLAAIGVGLSDDWRGVTRFVSHGVSVAPRPENRGVYGVGYSRFRAEYVALKAVRSR